MTATATAANIFFLVFFVNYADSHPIASNAWNCNGMEPGAYFAGIAGLASTAMTVL